MGSVQLADGTLVRKLAPVGARGWQEMQHRQRTIAFSSEPVFDAEAAKAHLEIGAPVACIVVAKRGPKGGWPYAKFISNPSEWVNTSLAFLRKQQDRGYTLHLGRVVSE